MVINLKPNHHRWVSLTLARKKDLTKEINPIYAENEWAPGAHGHDIVPMSKDREKLGFVVHSSPMIWLGLHVTSQLSHAGFDPGNARLNG